jgi:DNA (cytosine-5)-methyltransferase 1
MDGLKNHEPKILNAGSDDFAIALQIGPHQKLCNVRAGDRSIPTWDIPEVFGKTTKQEQQVLVLIRQLRRQIRVRGSGDADPVRISDIAKHVKGDVKRVVDRLHKNGYLRKFGQRFDLAHAFNGKYRRLAWDQLAPAVDTRFGEPRYFLHPEEQRGLSVREAARIQGFPDDFMFEGPRSAQYRMVGNAVPPPLAKQIAIAVRDQLL